MEPSTRDDLKTAMGNWPSGVAIVAAPYDAGVEAITVSSFISISLDPPLVLVSLGRHAPILALIQQNPRFTISALAADQTRIAALVADRVPQLKTLFTPPPDPMIEDALFNVICSAADLVSAGDHVLCIGAVEEVRIGRAEPPLLYYRRKYRGM